MAVVLVLFKFSQSYGTLDTSIEVEVVSCSDQIFWHSSEGVVGFVNQFNVLFRQLRDQVVLKFCELNNFVIRFVSTGWRTEVQVLPRLNLRLTYLCSRWTWNQEVRWRKEINSSNFQMGVFRQLDFQVTFCKPRSCGGCSAGACAGYITDFWLWRFFDLDDFLFDLDLKLQYSLCNIIM